MKTELNHSVSSAAKGGGALSFPTLCQAGHALYTADNWQDGRNLGGVYVAQVWAEPDAGIPECAEMVRGQKLPDNDVEGDRWAQLFAASPDMARALEKSLRTLLDCQETLRQLGKPMAASHLDLTIDPVRAALIRAGVVEEA